MSHFGANERMVFCAARLSNVVRLSLFLENQACFYFVSFFCLKRFDDWFIRLYLVLETT